MKTVVDILEEKITAAMAAVSGLSDCAAMVAPATDARFGDYQANGVMALAKELKTNPRELAQKVVEKLELDDICEQPEIAGPGFINLRLKPQFIAERLLEINDDSSQRLGIEKATKPQTIVVDFSGPNIAKQMHVGHLRSTIIGDCICRILELQGHTVIRQNHIGDWGLQMGNVIKACRDFGLDISSNEWAVEYLKQDELKGIKQFCENIVQRGGDQYEKFVEAFRKRGEDAKAAHLTLLEESYKRTSEQAQQNSEVADEIRSWTRELQNGDPVACMFWDSAREITLEACFDIYAKLTPGDRSIFEEKDICGESAYNDDLPKVVANLKQQNVAVESEGAVCVFPEGFKDKEGKPLPVIIQKSDGAYLYATTDLAAIRYRVDKLKVDRIIYVTDARQNLHFDMLFAVAKMAGWAKNTELIHVTFGSVLGEDGKPLKTREGQNVKLKDLLDEAVERAKAIVEEKNPDLDKGKKEKIAKAVGIGAVKYADYSNNRQSDYIFSFDKMLALDGNTAPYMQYAYARIKSIERKAVGRALDIEKELAAVKSLNLSEPAELDLGKCLLRYGEVIESSAADYRPNYLTGYLFELAQKFSGFYTDCPVLKAGPDKRPTRLLLCDLTAETIRHGLGELLGIEVVKQM